ncbi:hypothetical protein [Peptoanaerobacter stomatis]|uniref:hypothetical protein n=1 Tax=Peptoanaerobacter stomatis TaxID=796937 RepID=UPI003FA0F23E
MIRYEIKLKKIGEMTTLPDSQRLFGFLINNSKKYCSEDEISDFVKGVRDYKEKCMISSILPTGYYPTPKEFIIQNLQKRLVKNNEEIKLLEEKQKQIKKESDSLIRDTINKKKKEKSKKNLKSEIEDLKTDYNNISYAINNLSTKRIYETIKSMDFIDQNQLKNMLQLGEVDEKLEVEDFKDFEYINKNQNFIQKFRLENQIKQLPGMTNVAYSLPILSFKNKAGDIQKDFSFFVRVSKDSCISKTLEGMRKILKKNETIPCFLGGKGSSGYNEYNIFAVENLDDSEEEKSTIGKRYLNLGVLLPNLDNVDMENSVVDIYTSDRKPFEIENEVSKVISFVTAGSVIKVNDCGIVPYTVGKSIDNSKYNPMYKKNAIIFGNSYLLKLEVDDEA